MSLSVKLIQVTPFEQNCALLWDGETMQGAVIDPGGDVPRILAAIEKNNVAVTGIFLTHGHIDHAGGAAELAAALGVPITGPGVEDKFLLDGLAAQGAKYGLSAQDCTPDHWLHEGDKITLGGASFEVLHCPGHTPGHIVFINHEGKFCILGDVLFRNSVGRTDFPYCDTQALMAAIKTKLLVLPDDYRFICGHGVSSSIGAERRSNPFING
ncbi:MAG: MBL fold metallo-hydrolase [Acidocella sp.]|nr:MBL fold metallo-hydrolase [Acidocella sp.]